MIKAEASISVSGLEKPRRRIYLRFGDDGEWSENEIEIPPNPKPLHIMIVDPVVCDKASIEIGIARTEPSIP